MPAPHQEIPGFLYVLYPSDYFSRSAVVRFSRYVSVFAIYQRRSRATQHRYRMPLNGNAI